MSDLSLWMVLAGILLIAEITSGTFYLLMVSIGALAGALVAQLGYGASLQVALAAVVAVLATLGLFYRRKGTPTAQQSEVKLDVGNRVHVQMWDDNRRTTIAYRGSSWAAESVDEPPLGGSHTIVDVQGALLKLKHSSSTK